MTAHPALIELARECAQLSIERLATFYGVSPEEYAASVRAALRQTFSGCDIWARVSSRRFDSILEAGVLAGMHDDPRPAAWPRQQIRKLVERIMHAGGQPTYGFLSPGPDVPATTSYGRIALRLRNVKEDATFIEDDSWVIVPHGLGQNVSAAPIIVQNAAHVMTALETGNLETVRLWMALGKASPRAPSPILDPHELSLKWGGFPADLSHLPTPTRYLRCPLTQLNRLGHAAASTYFEVQIHRLVTLEDVAHVHFDGLWDYQKYAPQLETLGISCTKTERPTACAEVWDALIAQFILPAGTQHGPAHWKRVEENAVRLARLSGGDTDVARWFGCFHDAGRFNEERDTGHGKRGANLVTEYREYLGLTADQLAVLHYACAYHERGQTSEDPTVGACWDADRLELGRVGTKLEVRYLSTQAGREEAVSAAGPA